MDESDRQLRDLLAAELRKHGSMLADDSVGDDEARRALHAAKGSAAVAGEAVLADALARLERRLRRGDGAACGRAARLLVEAAHSLEAGRPALADPWPRPPDDLEPAPLEPATAARYGAQVRERIARLDEAIGDTRDAPAAIERAFRHVHTLKGAAGTVGDEPLAWFCHGLETRLRAGAQSEQRARDALAELARWRAVLSELLDDPARALSTLRGRGEAGGEPALEPPPRGPDAPPAQEHDLLRVPVASMDRVLEHTGRLTMFAGQANDDGLAARASARRMRELRSSLAHARRLIGPPRPWGAPAAALASLESLAAELGALADRLDGVGARTRLRARTAMREVGSTRAEIAQMRQATLSAVLDTARDSILALAQREQRRLRVLVRGRDVPVDRRLAEALVDPVLQLGRNAVAHGIERPEDRLAAGKPATGTIALVAERRGAHLLIAVRDDGAGVDVEALRRRAIQAGVWTQQGAGAPEDEALTHLLFLPGLTTRQAPDMLSGRGVGLDLTRGMVRRLGGTVRVRSRRGRGFEAIIDVPLQERGMVPIVIVGSRGHRFALSARRVLRVRELASEDAAHTPALASFVGTPAAGTDVPRLAIDVGRTEVEEAPVAFAIERVQGVEMAMVRPVPPLVAAAGPYVGLVSASDGEPALLLDVLLLADRVRAREPGGSRTPAPPAVDLGRGRDRGAWP